MLCKNNNILADHNIFKIPFNNRQWRMLLNSVAKAIDKDNIGIEVISPFGFETLRDTRFLNKMLRKFYCYVGIPKNKTAYPLHEIARQFKNELFSQLDQDALKDIVIVVEQEQFFKLREPGYKCKPTDKLIDIQCRFVDTSIMEDYAKYIICCLDALQSGRDEPREFFVNKRHRVRTYQLYMMVEGIFGHLAPLESQQQNLYKLIPSRISNSIVIFYDKNQLLESADETDQEIMLVLIKPRIAKLYESIISDIDAENIVVDCVSYHVSDNLRLTISKRHYQNAVNMIRDSYINFV